jgi:hypothetical protein
MKTLLITLSLGLFYSISYSQTITLSDFTTYRKLNDEQFKEKLDKTTLQLDDEEDVTKFITRTTYKYADNATVSNDLLFVNHLAIDKSQNRNRVSFQFKSDELLYNYLVEMKRMNFEEVLYKVVDRQMIHVYSDGKQTIEIIVSKSLYTNDVNVYYTFAIYDDLEYNAQFAEENSKFKIQENNELYKMQNAIGLYSSLK